jgi:phenylalanyl-tRNA synthetase alpha chain
MNLDTLKQKISVLKSKANNDFLSSVSKEDLDDSYRSFLGKKGEVNLLLKTLGSLPQEKRKEAGKILNELKSELEEKYLSTSVSLSSSANQERLKKKKLILHFLGFKI